MRLFEYLGYFGNFGTIILISLPRNGIMKPSGSADDGTPRKTAPVVAVDVAPDEPPIKMRWLRGKPVQVSKISKITQISCTGNHCVEEFQI